MITQLDVIIPVLPTSLNALYGYGKGRVYKTKVAKEWAKKAALIIGAANQGQEWDGYWLEVEFDVYMENVVWRDVDNCIKLALDTLATKLRFDDRYIYKVCASKWFLPRNELRIRLGKVEKLNEMA